MEYLKRLLYLGYYIKTTDWKKYRKFVVFASSDSGISLCRLVLDSFWSALRYNISLEEYFMYFFWQKKDSKEKTSWAGVGYMYAYHLLMTPKHTRETLKNKALFLQHNADFITRKWIHVEKNDFSRMYTFIAGMEGKVVIKKVDGNCGRAVEVYDTQSITTDRIVEIAKRKHYTLAEEYITQHPELMRLSPAGLNTIRIVTQINKAGGVDVLAARIRITVHSFVDNLHAGNMAASIDIVSGKIMLPAIYSDITRSDETVHPVTGVEIVGFQIPRWEEALAQTKAIALHNRENRSVGWDIAITEKGVDFVEGNHDWNQDIFQMPVRKGLKKVLEQYVSEIY